MKPQYFKNLSFLTLITILLFSGCTEETYVTPETYGSISGRVLSELTKQPLAGAVIRISPSAVAVTTDSEGYFKADSVTAGNYTLITSLDKYKNDLTSVVVQGHRNADISVFLVLDNKQNAAPANPVAIKPAHQSTGAEINQLTLSWQSSDADKDTLTYDVVLFKEGETAGTTVATGIRTDSLIVGNLTYGAIYYWQVIVKDGVNAPVKSEIWTFKTKNLPDFPYYFSRKVGAEFQLFASDGTETVQLTSIANNWRPVINAQRNRLAFISNREREAHIYVADLDGRNLSKVTSIPVAAITPISEISICWSPDGTQILYPNYDKLYSVRQDGTGTKVVARSPVGKFFASADWTAQNNRIIARLTTTSVYENEIVVIDPEIGISTPVLSNIKGKTGNPVFSIDGRKILYTLDVDNFQNQEGRQLNARMLLYDLTDKTTQDISYQKPAGTNDLDPRFSSTGGTVIFVNTNNDGFSPYDVYTLQNTANGTIRVRLLADAQTPYWK